LDSWGDVLRRKLLWCSLPRLEISATHKLAAKSVQASCNIKHASRDYRSPSQHLPPLKGNTEARVLIHLEHETSYAIHIAALQFGPQFLKSSFRSHLGAISTPLPLI